MIRVSNEDRLETRNRPQEYPQMYQEWRDLLFLHWEYDAEAIQRTLPPGLTVDTFKGNAYVSLTSFFLQNVSVGNLPSMPGLSDFVEVNTRTYVYDQNGIPGIWFYSLDINSILASAAARQQYYLPYYYATLTGTNEDNIVNIKGERVGEPRSSMQFKYTWDTNFHQAEPGTLDFFLIERYVLYSLNDNQLKIARVHHEPYPLASSEVLKYDSNLFKINHLTPPKSDYKHIHYASGVNVDIFKPKNDLNFHKAKEA